MGAHVLGSGHLIHEAHMEGRLQVDGGGRADMHGDFRGALRVAEGGSARFYALLFGQVRNHGHIRLLGSLDADIEENTGRIEVAVGTLVRRGDDLFEVAYDGSETPRPNGTAQEVDIDRRGWLTYQPDGTFAPATV